MNHPTPGRRGGLRALGLAAGVACAAGIPLAVPGGAAASAAAASHSGTRFVSVRSSRHQGYDRLVFRFSGQQAPKVASHFLAQPGAGQSSSSPPTLLVTFASVSGAGPAQRAFNLPSLIQLVTAQNPGNGLALGIAMVRHARPQIHRRNNPARVVMDFPDPARARVGHVYFAEGSGADVQPFAGYRTVPASGRAAVTLWRLFAGPTQKEQGKGAYFVSSGATGFRQLSITGGVAQLQLTGGCSAATSAITVGQEITQTLHNLPRVQTVKILGPDGSTQQPLGPADSVPSCLTPIPPTGVFLAGLAILVAVGIGLGVVLSVLSIVRGLILRPRVIRPVDYQAERVKQHPVGTGEFEPDTAWPFYPLRQMRADLGKIEAERQALWGLLWKPRPRRPFFIIVLLPVWLLVICCFLIAGLTTLLLTGLYALASLVCAAVTVALSGAGVLLLRGAGHGWHKVFGTAASCPKCYHVTEWPAYRCPGCSALHRDVRPGRLGLVGRRCKCGKLLPTMVLRASRSLQPVCQKCGTPLRPGAGAVRDVRIPVFGDTSAGKTRLLFAALDSLIQVTKEASIPFGFPDDESENQATMALDLIRSGRETVKTSVGLPTALTCRVGKGVGTTLVHLFDAAGEAYQNAERHDSLGFLDQGHGLVYVLDPFAIGAIRDRLTSQRAEVIRRAHAASGDPETAYGEVVTRLRDSGVAASGQRLAVVVSKADLLIDGGLEPPTESDAIADWLDRNDIHNLVLSARREFAEVRFFTVASLAATQAPPAHDPGAPLQWLLSSRGVRLPAGPQVPRSRDGSAQDDRARTEQGDPAKAPS
jgi:hypothetical protein